MKMRRPAFLQFLAPLLILALALQGSPAYGLRPAGLEESGAKEGFVARLGHPLSLSRSPTQAGLEGSTAPEAEEPPLTVEERRVAANRYQLPPGAFQLEYDPARSMRCALGHPPLLWRVPVVETVEGTTAYVGTGCCQTLFHTTPAEIGAAQTATHAQLAQVTKYAPWLPASPERSETMEAVARGTLDPARWHTIATLTAALDHLFGEPLIEIGRRLTELRQAPRPARLAQAGYLTSHEATILQRLLAVFAASPVTGPRPTDEELEILRAIHTRLAKHPDFLAARTLTSWARGEAPPPMTPEALAREEQRMPNWSANLWAAQHLLPGIRDGTITHVVDCGAGQEPLYRLLALVGGPDAAAVVVNVESHPETYAVQTNPRRLHMSITDVQRSLTPPATSAAEAAAALLAAPEQVDAVTAMYTLDQLKTPAQQQHTILEATRITRVGGLLIVTLPLGRELSQPYLDALDQLGWQRREGYPAEVPLPTQRGLPDAVKAAHRQSLADDGLPPEEIERILAIEERFFSKSSYAVVWEKVTPYDPAQGQRVRAEAFTLVDVSRERRSAKTPTRRGSMVRADFLHAALLAATVTPDQLAIEATPYVTKVALRARHRDLETQLERLGRYLALLPGRLRVGDRTATRAQVRQLLADWYDPDRVTFSEADARWLMVLTEDRLGRGAAFPAEAVLDVFPDLVAQLRELESTMHVAGDWLQASALFVALRGATARGNGTRARVAIERLDRFFQLSRDYLGMPFAEADHWYRARYPSGPPFAMIPTTLRGHLLVITVYMTQSEKPVIEGLIRRLDNAEGRWMPAELIAIHDHFLAAMERDEVWERAQDRVRTAHRQVWSLRHCVDYTTRQLAIGQYVSGNEYAALRRRVPGGLSSLLAIAGLSPDQITQLDSQRRSIGATQTADARGDQVWSRDTIAAWIAARYEAGQPFYPSVAHAHSGAWSAATRFWPSWGAAVAEVLGLSREEANALMARQRLTTRRGAAAKILAARGWRAWSQEAILEFIRARYRSGGSLLAGHLHHHYGAMLRARKRFWPTWEAAVAGALGLSLEAAAGLLEAQRASASQQTTIQRASANANYTVWTTEDILSLIRSRHQDGKPLLAGSVRTSVSSGVLSAVKRFWADWDTMVAEALQIPVAEATELLQQHKKVIDRARGAKAAATAVSTSGTHLWDGPALSDLIKKRHDQHDPLFFHACAQAGWLRSSVSSCCAMVGVLGDGGSRISWS